MKKRKPNYVGNGVAVWINAGKNGKADYLAIKLSAHNTTTAFKQEEKKDSNFKEVRS